MGTAALATDSAASLAAGGEAALTSEPLEAVTQTEAYTPNTRQVCGTRARGLRGTGHPTTGNRSSQRRLARMGAGAPTVPSSMVSRPSRRARASNREHVQADGRNRRWARIAAMGGGYAWLGRLPVGELAHDAFFDRRFRP